MAGLGTLINVFAITIGGILGIIFRNRLAENHQKGLNLRVRAVRYFHWDRRQLRADVQN